MHKIRKKYAKNMHFSRGFLQFLPILTFPKYFWESANFLHIFCVFFAYFLHITNFWQFSLNFSEICKKYTLSRGFFGFLIELATAKSAYAIVHIFCIIFADIFQSAYFLHIAPCHQKRIAIESIEIRQNKSTKSNTKCKSHIV